MNRPLIIAVVTAFFLGGNGAFAQNVKSDEEKAKVEQQKMQEKEKGAATGQHTDAAQAKCEGKTGDEKKKCVEEKRGKDAKPK